MAHRVAELMERAEQVDDGPDREKSRGECAALIMRLWAHRSERQHGRPLSEIAEFLDEYASESPQAGAVQEGVDPLSWTDVLHRIRQLSRREEDVCRAAAIADVSLEQDRQWLEEEGEELSDDERKIITYLLHAQGEMHTSHFRLDDAHVPDFASLPSDERTVRVVEQLQKISQDRQKLFQQIMAGKGSGESTQSDSAEDAR
jgi:DNA-binding transcriptional MerR regulator